MPSSSTAPGRPSSRATRQQSRAFQRRLFKELLMEVSMHSFTTMTNRVRWLRRVTLAVAIIMIGWGLSVVLGQPVTAWFTASATVWMVLLLISAFWQLRGSFTAIAALALASAVVSRLFSILRLNPPASIAQRLGADVHQGLCRLDVRASFRESHPGRTLSIPDLHALFRQPGNPY